MVAIVLLTRESLLSTHHFSLRDIVEEDEVTEHGDEADEAQPCHHVDDGVLQGEFS